MIIDIELSKKSVFNAQKRLKRLKAIYPLIRKEFIKRSLAYIKEVARQNIVQFIAETNSSWYESTGTLERSWISYVDEIEGVLENICEYAAWYEYGTGIVGASMSHPNASERGYQYDTNNHGTQGWVYTYEGQKHWTSGMKAHPYLHNADMTYITTKKYKEIFREVVKEAEKGL